MAHKPPDRIRNVALVGHRGSGKTTLAEAILFEAGVIRPPRARRGRHSNFDFEADEQERGMSIGAAVTSFEHDGRKVNVIDTPGDPSFVADTLGALRVVDAAVFVVNGVMGVEVNTERLWRRADEEGLARLVFVNMLDRERADFFRALDSLQSTFGQHVVATEIPIGYEHETRGVIDLIDMTAFEYEGEGRDNAKQVEIPEELAVQADEYREKLMDEVAENSDELMERYLEGEEISHDEIVAALKKGVNEGHLFPVTCGIAIRNLGTNRLLEALVEDLPSPAMHGGAKALDGETPWSRSSPMRKGTCSPSSSRPRLTPTPAGSACCACTRECWPRTRTSSTSPRTRRSASASCPLPRARRCSRSTSWARVTSARWRSCARRRPATCSPTSPPTCTSVRSTCPRP